MRCSGLLDSIRGRFPKPRSTTGRLARRSPQRRRNNLSLDCLEDRVLLSGIGPGQHALVLTGAPDVQEQPYVAWSAAPGAAATVSVFVQDSVRGPFSADQRARIRDGIAELNRTWDAVSGVGLNLIEVADHRAAQIRVTAGRSSACGSKAAGVLGCTEYYVYTQPAGEFADGHDYYQFAGPEAGLQATVTLIADWAWYAGADATQIKPTQYDLTTVVVHELAHAVGLGHDASKTHVDETGQPLNGDGKSATYPTLEAGDANRQLSEEDLARLRQLYAAAASSQDEGAAPAAELPEDPDADEPDDPNECDDGQDQSPAGEASDTDEECDPAEEGGDGDSEPNPQSEFVVVPLAEQPEPAPRAEHSSSDIARDPQDAEAARVVEAADEFRPATLSRFVLAPPNDSATALEARITAAITSELTEATQASLAAGTSAATSENRAIRTMRASAASATRDTGMAARAIDAVLADDRWAFRVGQRGAEASGTATPNGGPSANTAAAAVLAVLLGGYWGIQAAEPASAARRQFLMSHLLDPRS
jgi:hypothetical protein